MHNDISGTRDWSNWAGNQRATATGVSVPATLAELCETVRRAAGTGQRVKVVGSGHSFTDIAHTDSLRLELSALAASGQADGTGPGPADDTTGPGSGPADGPGLGPADGTGPAPADGTVGAVRIDRARGLVTVPAGMTLRTLNELLANHGLAVPNLGDIDAQTIAGALATGTHGTGADYGCLATFVAGLTLVTGTGDVVRCSADREPEIFAAARVGLGAVGIVVEVTLACVPAFVLRAHERPAPLAEVLTDLPALLDRHDHIEFYWFPYTERAQLKTNDRVPADDAPLSRLRGWVDDEFLANTVFAGTCRLGRAVPALVPTINAVAARALTARSYTGRSDRVFCTPRRVRFVEMEYGLPRAALPEALAALRRLVDRLPLSSRSRSGSPHPTTSGSPTVTSANRSTWRSTSTWGCRTSRTSGVSRRSPEGSTGDRTGARCTIATPNRCARSTPGSTTSSPFGTAWTRSGSSPIRTPNGCSAADRRDHRPAADRRDRYPAAD